MSEAIIYGTRIEHNDDVSHGLEYLRNHWNDRYVLDVFENAKTSVNQIGDFRIHDVKGTYVLKFISQHHFSLAWRDY